MSSDAWRVGGLLVLALVASVSSASGPGVPTPVFWSDRAPVDLVAFLDGRLGVLTPELGDELRLLAYLHLTGRTLSPSGRAAWEERLGLSTGSGETPAPSGLERWLKARSAVPGVARQSWISTTASMSLEGEAETRYLYWDNCLDDAFAAAAGRLGSLADRPVEAVREWVEAQDLVFVNCSRPGNGVPEPLSESSPTWAREERAYQRAAALFYATRFEEARVGFEEIATSPSPLAALAALGAARARIRVATLEMAESASAFSRATESLQNVLDDPRYAEVHPSARRLLRYVGLRADPDAALAALLDSLLDPQQRGLDAEGIRELHWLLDRLGADRLESKDEESGEAGDLLAWWSAMRAPAGNPRAAQIFTRWREGRQPHWLIPALWVVDARSDQVEQLLEAAAAAAGSWGESPAAPTIELRRAGLLAERGRREDAMRMVELALERLTEGERADRNRWRELRALAESDALELAVHGQLVPLGFRWEGGPWVQRLESLPEGYDYEPGQELWPDSAVERLDRATPIAELVRIAGEERVVPPLRRRAAAAAWVRAALLGEAGAADASAAALAALAPELADGLRSFRETAGADARRFVAALLLLRNPGLSPRVRQAFGRSAPYGERALFGDNGWCGGVWRGPERSPPGGGPVSLSAAISSELGRLESLRPAPVELGEVVLSWVRAHPEDPRAPEALHRVVVATRYGCAESERNGEVSRAAFRELHRRYPSSEWTGRTPYWYR